MPADLEPRGNLVPLPYRRKTEAALRQASPLRFAWRNRHATIPLAAPAVMWTAGQLVHWWHHGFDLEVMAGAASAIVWFTAPHKWDRPAEVWYARLSVIFAGAWLAWADAQGVHGGQEILLLIASAAWGFPFWWHKRPRGKRKRRRHAREVARWNAWWQSHAPAWGVAGSGIADVSRHASTDILDIQLWGGRQTLEDIRRIVPLMESALGGFVHHGMTRVERVKHNPSRVLIHLKREDPLREPVEWDESMISDDIMDPAPLGVRESGGWLKAALRRGWLILGRTRSGKSNELSVMLAKITKCRNARVLLIDMKGGRAARPWLPAVDWLATSREEARLLLGCAVAEVAARAAYAYNGTEQLEPTDEVPTLFVVIDETYAVTSETPAGDAQCATMLAIIASQGQGVEIYPVVLSQYGGLTETVRTEQTRSNLNGRLCFQTEHSRHGAFALGDDAERLRIDTTTLRQKGTFYYREDSEAVPEQIRGPLMDHDMAKQVALRNAGRTGLHSRPLVLYCGGQPISAEKDAPTWQQVYDQRWERLPEAFRRDAPQAAHLTPPEDERVTNKINIRPVHPAAARINAEIEEVPAVSDEDIRRARALRAERGEAPVSLRNEFDQRRARFASLMDAAGSAGITPDQLAQGSGFSREWVRRLLNALVEGKAVTKVRTGLYRADMDTWEALEMLREHTERLAAEARQMTDA